MPEEKQTESSSEEQPQPQQAEPEKSESKFLRLFFVGLYLCAVTGMGMTLSIYYLFLWDSRMPELPKRKDKISIPEHIAIRLVNSTEITAEEFYRKIQNYYQSIHEPKENAINNNNRNNKDNTIKHKTTSHSIYNYRKRKHPKRITMTTPPPLTTTTTRLIPILKSYRRKNRLRIDEYNDEDEDDEDDNENSKTADGSGQFINTDSVETKLTFS